MRNGGSKKSRDKIQKTNEFQIYKLWKEKEIRSLSISISLSHLIKLFINSYGQFEAMTRL